jgi:lipoate-protein ligase A
MQTAHYRYIDTGIQGTALNMAIDEAILVHYLRGEAPPTLRVFRWSQPSISLGRFQNVEKELELERCERQGVAIVRRPTGGRAVYHRDEFTYSIVIGKREGTPAGVVAAYAYLARGLIVALHSLGVRAILSEGKVSKNPSAACFASSTQADLTSGGYKLVGSAQVWREDGLLQQGSLPLDDRAAEFFDLLRYPEQAAREKALAHYHEQTSPLHSLVPDVKWDQVAQAFRSGFSEALHEQFLPTELSQSEWQMAQQLVEEKYHKLIWRQERVNFITTEAQRS